MAYAIRQYSTKSGKRYEVRYRKPDGTATGKRGFKRKMDADAWGAANVTTAKSVGAYIDPQSGRRLVEDFWEPWLAAKKTKAKPSYVETLERAWRVHVAPKWGMREVRSITHDEVQIWVSGMEDGTTTSTKWSTAHNEERTYDYRLYMAKVSVLPADWRSDGEFIVGSKRCRWMTLDDMRNDPKIYETNSDVIQMLGDLI